MDDHHADLKNLIQESKGSLLELEERLQKAEMWLEENASMQALGQEELGKCVLSLSNSLDKLKLKIDSVPPADSIQEIHHQIRETCDRALQTFNQIDLEYQKQMELDQLHERFRIDTEDTTGGNSEKPSQSSLRQLLDLAQRYFAEGQYEQCSQLLHSLLLVLPDDPETLKLLRDAERRWEDQRMAEEMAIHVDNVKREAMNLFDQEKYQDCLGKFEFLCEVDPDNVLYQDYLNLSRGELNRFPSFPAAKESDLSGGGESLDGNLDPPHFPSNLNIAEDKSSSCPADVILPLKESSGLPTMAEENDAIGSSHQSELALHPIPQYSHISGNCSAAAFSPTLADIKTENSTFDLRMEKSSGKSPASSEAVSPMPYAPEPSENLGLEGKIMPPEENENQPEEQISADEKKNKDLFFLAIAATILILLFPAWLTWHWAKNRKDFSASGSNTPLVITTLPPGAAVFLDGKLMGNSGLTLSQVSAGKHSLRLEKAGYNAETEIFNVQPGLANHVSIQLTAIPSLSGAQEDPQAAAKSLLEQHRYIDAFQKSALILRENPGNEKGRQIQDQVRSHYLQIGDQALKANKWEEARKSYETLSRLFPQERAATTRLKLVKGKIQEQQAVSSAETARKARIQELEESLMQALKAGNYFPPRPGNALTQAQQLHSLDSANTAAFEALSTIRQSLSTQAQQRISQHDFEKARIVIAQLQIFFSGSPDISSLNALLRAEESKQKNLLNDWLQKIDTAMAAGHFVFPSHDNVILYCNRLLAQGGAKAKAVAIKQEAFTKAVTQARNLVASEKFEDAHDVFTALQAFSPFEEGIPVPAEEIKTELARLEFHDWPVTHDHALGSCSGKLQFNGYVISYLPRGDSKDGFHLKMSEIKQTRTGERLKIEFRNKTYRFQMNQTASRKTTEEELNPPNQTTSSLLATKSEMNSR